MHHTGGGASPLLPPGHGLGPRFDAGWGRPAGATAAVDLFGSSLDRALGAVQSVTGAPGAAVAGALLFERYAVRVVAPVLGALYRGRRAVDARIGAVAIRGAEHPIDEVFFTGPTLAVTGPPGRTQVADDLLRHNLLPAANAVHARARTSTRVLYGGAANAVAMAFLHLSWQEPDPDRYVEEARRLLDGVGWLDHFVTIASKTVDSRQWMYMDRRTCCLAFRTSERRASTERFCAACPIRSEDLIWVDFAAAVRSYAERNH